MPRIHPTAIVDPRVELADDVEVGPYCILEGRIRIGAGTRLRNHCFMQGPMVLGENNDIWPFSCLGVAPQTHHFDPAHEGPGTVIGDHNVFREHSSVHRSIHETEPTRIGSRNLFMDSAHAGHDVIMGDRVVVANGAAIGGHARIYDHAIIGGNAAVHQFVRVGRGAMISGTVGAAQDVMPWFTVTLLNVVGSFNIVGLRRQGFSSEEIDTVRWVYRLFARSGTSIKVATERLRERAGEPLIDEYLEFVTTAERAICTMRGRRDGNERTEPASSG
ncbi:MAG: acyl-ACP--UDP-N-acetylglucosamine O-acyltransferase [Planctomycetota bacterium]|nr:acyl-ACP--UDP-N-acetylglucosamine O-acyltransferase [Planctomycetota bacterium]